ncbi:MAG: cysteine hydrolase [Rhodospirillales bacterium]|nr:cysteine hydrolase [Rhodospirillales bacterium]
MHPTELPQYAIDGALRRRGKIHAIEQVDPAKCALVVIDMQNVFLKEGAPAETPMAREIVPNINKLANAVRQTGGRVIWVQMTHSSENLDTWSFFYQVVSRPERARKMLEWMTPGSEGQQLWPQMDAQENDLYVEKTRYSVFGQGSSTITEVMTDHELDTVLITGTVSNVCCESSARDAMMLNYKTVMVSDGNAGHTDEEHLAALASIFQVFGDVYTTEELISLLESGAETAKRQAAE